MSDEIKNPETEQETPQPVKKGKKKDEMVTIRLFKDGDKYKDDVFVGVNGKAFKIQRGVEVRVPTYVADILEQSMSQDIATASLIESESAKSEDAALQE